MCQDGSVGNVYGIFRENHKLVMQILDPLNFDIRMEALTKFEMLLFDGGSIYGDSWKHVFYPGQLQHFFVDENPIKPQTK
jgi:hypothetical protein